MNVEIFLLALSCVISVQSVPRNFTQKLAGFPRLSETKNRLNFDLSKVLNEAKVSKFVDEEIFSYRLPNDSIPLRYDLWLKTDVEKGNFDFSGRVMIQIKIIDATDLITLHLIDSTVDKIDLLDVERNLIEPNLSFTYNDKLEFLAISLPRKMSPSEEIVLDISYNGKLLDNNIGFYRASYEEDGDTVWFASTKFGSTNARHAMPCYDEPGIRAVIGLEIQHDSSYKAVSNMPIVSREVVPGTNYVTSKFQDTPPMQTYLLAFVISNFDFISNNDVNVEQRIYAKPQSIAEGQGEFALSVVGPILRKLEEHLGVNYPLPKTDHAAIPNVLGAMENFG